MIRFIGARLGAALAIVTIVTMVTMVTMPAAAEQTIDRRSERSAVAAEAREARTARQLEAASGRFGRGLATGIDASGRLRSLARTSPPLSGPDRRDAETVARDFVRTHRDLLELDDDLERSLELAARDRSGPNALLRFRQQWNGIPVFQSDLRVHVAPQGEVTELQLAIERDRPAAAPEARIPAAGALRRALEELEPPLRDPRIDVEVEGADPRSRTELRAGPRADHVIAQWVYFPLEPEPANARSRAAGPASELRLAWLLDAVSSDGTTYYEAVVDARDGDLLYRTPITSHDTFGLAFEGGTPQPSATSGIVPPSPNPPAIVGRSRVSFAGDPKASPEGWVGAAGETIGNNVTAREDRRADNELTLGATAAATAQGGDRMFEGSLQLGPGAPSPVSFGDAAVTSLFYWINQAHDYFYNLGFTEAAGNFQEDNFGRGGVGNDSVRGDAQDGADLTPPNRNNANFSTPSEGSRPRMQMYLWGPVGGPYVDSDFDAEVILHEYSHGVFGRLTPSAFSGAQGGAMHEGNADFFALNYLTPESASADGDFPVGAYSVQNFTRGIRTRPYSTDPTVNDLVFADFGKVNGLTPEVHRDGEIWAEALWELRARLIEKHGYAEGRHRSAQLLVDAMKRSAINPSFLDMRDAIIQADDANHGGADQPEIWGAFARRGMGYMAATTNGTSLHVAGSSDLPPKLGKMRFFETVYFAGETVRVYVGDENNRDATIQLRLETTGGDRETLTIGRAGVLYRATLATAEGAAAPEDGKLQVAPGDRIRALYRDGDDGSGAAREVAAEVEVRAGYTTALGSSSIPAEDETPLGTRGTNVVTQLRLPFAFPFFDRLVTTVWVSTNGLVTIGAPNGSGNNGDMNLFGRYGTIAVMWDALRTSGAAQPGEGIYVSRPTSDSIRIRWAAETTNGFPVNFAVTLGSSGTIVFDYGSGNTAVSPTVGLSRGTETLTRIISSHSSSGAILSLDGASSIRWEHPGLELRSFVFPFFRSSADRYTGFAVANRGAVSADVAFEALQDGGDAVEATANPSARAVAEGAQIALVGEQIFAITAGGAEREGWVEARATGSALAMFQLYGDTGVSLLDGAVAASKLARELYLGRIDVGGGSTTSLYLVNPGTAPANVTVEWRDAAGKIAGSVARTIAARGRLAASASALFPAASSGYLRVTSDVALAGVETIEKSGDLAMLRGQEPGVATTLYGPQFASGLLGATRYRTELDLINTAAASRTVSIQLVGNDGKAVSGSGIRNPVVRTLAPGEQLRTRGDVLFGMSDPSTGTEFYEGSLVITADGAGIVGDVLFGDAAGQRFSTILALDGAPASELVFAHVAEGTGGGVKPYFTGLALYNPGAATITVDVEFYSRRGLEVGRSTLTLAPGARISRTAAQLVAGLNQIGGTMRVVARGGSVTGFAVYGDSSLDVLAVIPAQALAR